MLAYFKPLPKVGIDFVDRLYRHGDDLHTRVSIKVEKPGLKVRRASVQILVDHRYSDTKRVPVFEHRQSGGLGWPYSGGRMRTIGDVNGANDILPHETRRVTERSVDTTVLQERVIIADGTLKYRIQSFDADFRIVRPESESKPDESFSYFVRLRMDLPRMPDIKLHRAVRVEAL